MRLVKIGLAIVNTTVGAFTRNVDGRCSWREGDGGRRRHRGRLPGAAHRRLPARGPRPVAGLRRATSGRSSSASPARPAPLPTVFVLGRGGRCTRACATTAPRWSAGGKVLRPGAQGEAAHLQHLLRGAHLLPRLARACRASTTASPSATSSSASTSASWRRRSARTSGAPTGPMRRRTYSGAELVVNISASPFRVGHRGHRREMIATRAGDHQCTLAYANAVGGNDGLIFDGGGFVNQNGKLRARGAALPGGLRGGRGGPRPHHAAARGEHHLARWTARRGCRGRRAGAHDRDARRAIHAAGASKLTYPVPAAPQLLSARAGHAPLPPREALCEDLLDALALGVGDYFEKTRAFKTIGIALSGGRDSLLTLLIAHRYATRARPDEPGQLCCGPSTCPPATPRRRPATAAETICPRAGRAASRSSPSTRPSSASSTAAQQPCSAGRAADADHRAEHPGPAARAADVELVQLRGGPVPADGQHEREGGGLHHHRRRPDGRAGGHRQRARRRW